MKMLGKLFQFLNSIRGEASFKSMFPFRIYVWIHNDRFEIQMVSQTVVVMNKRNQQSSSQNFRAAIESAATKKQHELKLVATTEDYKEVTGYMVELFAKNKKIYFRKDCLLGTLKKTIPNNTVFDRIGVKGRDEIVSVLIEKNMLQEYSAEYVTKDKSGQITSILRWPYNGAIDIRQKKEAVRLVRYTTESEVYQRKKAEEKYAEELEAMSNDYWYSWK